MATGTVQARLIALAPELPVLFQLVFWQGSTATLVSSTFQTQSLLMFRPWRRGREDCRVRELGKDVGWDVFLSGALSTDTQDNHVKDANLKCDFCDL